MLRFIKQTLLVLRQVCRSLYLLCSLFLPKTKKPPYICNACKGRSKCALEKSFYCAVHAQKEYDGLKSKSRRGFAISEEELSHLDSVVSPLIRNGQSLHHIAAHHENETMGRNELIAQAPIFLSDSLILWKA